jgi:ketosteroid isomerase-like protein
MKMHTAEFPLQGSFARQFAQDWVNAWNSHDLDSILTHYQPQAPERAS